MTCEMVNNFIELLIVNEAKIIIFRYNVMVNKFMILLTIYNHVNFF